MDNFDAMIDYFGRINEFNVTDNMLKENRKGLKVNLKTFEVILTSLVKAGREKKMVNFFVLMGKCGFKDTKAYKIVVLELLLRHKLVSLYLCIDPS